MFNPESKLLGRLLGKEGPQGWAELLATSLSPAGVLSIGTSGAHSQAAARDAYSRLLIQELWILRHVRGFR